MAHGDPKHPKKNPHPVQRYEIVATADAPGPWDSVHGYVEYKVSNPDCTPKDEFLGVHAMPPIEGIRVEMARTGEKTWKGYFYRDAMLDEDYYGLGKCRWDATSVSANFVAHGESFGTGDVLSVLLKDGPQTGYFRKSQFRDTSFTGDGALDFSTKNPEYVKDSDAFFPIVVSARLANP